MLNPSAKGASNKELSIGEKATRLENQKKMWKLMILVLTRPIRIMAEPLVFFTDLFLCYQYIIFFLYFESYPLIFKGRECKQQIIWDSTQLSDNCNQAPMA